MGIDVSKPKGESLEVHEIKEITGANFLEECLTWGSVNKAPNPYALNRFCANLPLKAFSGYLSGPAAKQVEENRSSYGRMSRLPR